jgi:hypothetical protein
MEQSDVLDVSFHVDSLVAIFRYVSYLILRLLSLFCSCGLVWCERGLKCRRVVRLLAHMMQFAICSCRFSILTDH